VWRQGTRARPHADDRGSPGRRSASAPARASPARRRWLRPCRAGSSPRWCRTARASSLTCSAAASPAAAAAAAGRASSRRCHRRARRGPPDFSASPSPLRPSESSPSVPSLSLHLLPSLSISCPPTHSFAPLPPTLSFLPPTVSATLSLFPPPSRLISACICGRARHRTPQRVPQDTCPAGHRLLGPGPSPCAQTHRAAPLRSLSLPLFLSAMPAPPL
jgi:hypothetical protein